MDNKKKIIIISTVVIIVAALLIFYMYFTKHIEPTNNNKIETGKVDDLNIDRNNQINEKFFEEYLKVFEYLGDDFNSLNNAHIRNFIVFNYIVDKNEGLIEFKDIGTDGEYNQYVEVKTEDIQKLINNYFVYTDYQVESYEGEEFYKIEVNGEKTRIYTKSIGIDRHDMQIEGISGEGEDLIYVIAKFTLSDYEPSSEYTLKFSIILEDGVYRILECGLVNCVPEEVELKDFAGKYYISLGVDGFENLEITYKNDKLYFDWTYGPFNMTEATYKVRDYKFENNQLTVSKAFDDSDDIFIKPVMFIYRDQLFIKEVIKNNDGTYYEHIIQTIKE